jgi:deoxyhypusine synthase
MNSTTDGFTDAHSAVMMQSGDLPVKPVEVKGYDFNQGVDYHKLLQSFTTTGFQATNFGKGVEEINRMVMSSMFCCCFKLRKLIKKYL